MVKLYVVTLRSITRKTSSCSSSSIKLRSTTRNDLSAKILTFCSEVVYHTLAIIMLLFYMREINHHHKILDMRILNPQKMKKKFSPLAFLFRFIRVIFALYERLGQNISDTIALCIKNIFWPLPYPPKKWFS